MGEHKVRLEFMGVKLLQGKAHSDSILEVLLRLAFHYFCYYNHL